MKFKEFIGIDVSKLTLDVRLHLACPSGVFDNTPSGIRKMLRWVAKLTGLKREALFFIFEHTGLYSHQLACELSKCGIAFTMEPGLAVRRSLGIARGKDDAIDATKLALYGYRLRDELIPYQMPTKEIQVLKSLLRLRDRLVKQRTGYKGSLKEQKRVLDKADYQLFFQIQQQVIKQLSEHIKKVEAQLMQIINGDQHLKSLYKLIISVRGVGKQTTWYLIVLTHGFSRFKSWRAFATYAGTAPFPHRSGTSIRGKTKVSHLANKKIKSLLDLCAKSAIQHDPQLKAYYQRKLKQGKEKMSVINAVRNKILARVFAVVERKNPYVDNYRFAA